MRLSFLCALVALTALPSLALAQRAPAPPSELARAVERALADPKLQRSAVGVHVVDVESGEELFAKEADALRNPASNVKLITSAAALDRFGPAHTFSTEIRAEAAPSGGTIAGDLYVDGRGEGFLLYEDLLDWAATIKAKGIDEVSGAIVIDDGPFTGGAFLPPGFDQKDEDGSYRAPVGAFSVNFNAVDIIVTPGAPGAPALVRLDPPSTHITLVNDARTVPGSGRALSARSISLDEGAGTRVEVSGTIGQSASAWSTRKRIDNPPLFAGSALKAALQALGVKVGGEVRRGQAPSSGVVLVRHGSEPLSYLLMAMNKWSNNFMAEIVFRALGARPSVAASERGSWSASRAEVSAFLTEAGLDPGSYKLNNGSGLYEGNEVSARGFTTLLRYMYAHRWAAEYLASLAIAGVDGTLSRRFRSPALSGRIRAKTGTLNEVTALSGYATSPKGRVVAFSILVDDTPVRAWRVRSAQDEIAEAIARNLDEE